MNEIKIIGAGLAGCEAAWQLAKRGVKVKLFEMKPKKFSPAHKSKNYAELVCSNSFKSDNFEKASGLLKQELRNLNSLIMSCADKSKVPAGKALAVDREIFSSLVTECIKSNKLIEVVEDEVQDFEEQNHIVIIATGPLTSDKLAKRISLLCDGLLSFYDAAAPIVTGESVDMNYAFKASRYSEGNNDDYINCPMDKEEYEKFYKELILAQRVNLHDFEVNKSVYEGCMPIEIMASRGENTIRFGPMKPVGLCDPRTGHRPWAVLQLRKENIEATLYNLVGFQTNLKFNEQKRVFGMINALKNAEFIRYGVMHRNTFINSPAVLNSDLSLKKSPNIFLAGQITGVEGYVESTCSGLLAGLNAFMRIKHDMSIKFPEYTMIGSLNNYVVNSASRCFQPMGANYGIIPPLESAVKNKEERCRALALRSLSSLSNYINKRLG